ncbi:MAG TPA: PEGA domain-containing protein [Myxococcota bacterium]|nr:PEGA domain-containing protein [Myxococcota bacterium]
MRPSRLTCLLIFCAMPPAGACATLVNGSSQPVSINANVNGAEVVLNGEVIGMTPLNIKVKRGGGTLLVRKAGYSAQTLNMGTHVSGWFWGNLFSCGLLGSSTDWGSGGMYEYSPDNFFANLVPDGGGLEYDAANEQRDAEILHYCMVNYARLAHDIAVGAGEHLDGLLALSGRASLDRVALRDIRRGSPDVPSFAMAVLAALRAR